MSFQDIRGQDKPIQIIRQHLKQSRLSGSYLFAGPEAVGKRLVAKTLAKALNCEKQNSDSCDTCPSCLKIEKNQHPDVYMLDASTPLNVSRGSSEIDTNDSQAIKIGHIRQLQKNASLKPYEGRKKVFIVDNAHNLTSAASNALLKILEEPPLSSLIILVSAKPILLFKTIISRCQVLKFLPLSRAELEEILRKDYSLDNILAHFLAYFCEGRLGGALALKDTDIMLDKNRLIDQLVSSKKQINLNSFLALDKKHLRWSLNILTSWFRDTYLIKLGMPHYELIHFDRKTELLKHMQHFSFMDLDEILKSISDSLLYLEQNINIKLLLLDLQGSLR